MNDRIAAVGTFIESETALSKGQSRLDSPQDSGVPSRSCVIVGSGTLAVYCAEQTRAAGHMIEAVLATDTTLQFWAIREGIHCADSVEALKLYVREHPIDWLFSVVNPIILPASLIAQVRAGAFNYHDAPLPRYAGSHATSWALLAHESQHAISWHCIAATVDTGHIAVQRAVAINADDTALTLNLRCYQAAREGFVELLTKLGQSSLTTYPQALAERSFYAKSRRPAAGGYLCWTNTAQDLSALARALDFGELYPNPLGCPKLLLKQGTVRVARIKRLDQRSGAVPGTVVSFGQDAWQVATGSEDVLVSDFTTLEGEPLFAQALAAQSKLSQGKRLPRLTKKQSQAITEIHESLALSESFWQSRLARLQPLQLSFEQRGSDGDPEWMASAWCEPLRQEGKSSESLAASLTALAIYLARLTGQTQLQIGWCVKGAEDKLNTLTCLAPVVPMEIAVNLEQPFAVVSHAIEAEQTKLEQHRTFVRDLVTRYPTLRNLPELRAVRPWQVAVSVLSDGAESHLTSSIGAIGALLTLQVDGRGAFRWLYDAKRLDAGQVQRMSEHLQELGRASSGMDGVQTPSGKLNLLALDERKLLCQTWNATECDYPAYLCVHQLFEEQVERTPQAIALVYEKQTLSYAELNARANRLAHRLIKLGVKPDVCVAICVARSPAMVIALLAILKAGGAYVPLDPTYPTERLTYILADATPAILLADAAGRSALDEVSLTSLIVLDPNELPEEASTNPRVPELTSRHLAYVIYTSGSTGTPKGVMVVHSGLNNYLHWAMQTYAPKRGAVVSSSLSFDATVTSLWTSLLCGSEVLLLSDGKEIEALEAYVRQAQGEGLVKITPLHLEMLGQRLQADEVRTRVDVFVIGGETLNASTVTMWQRIQPDLRLINEYGPTETVVGCVAYDISTPLLQPGSVPIGRPIANTRIYLLDTYGQPVPLGAVGEIYIGGAGVARGYLNRPELTAERFLTDPFSDKSDARMYKSGDLARYLPDGALEFMGRNDHQVKIRGFRIEPGEIEARLLAHPQVREAAVLALGEASDKRLVAYVVAEPDEQLAHTLREHVVAGLPEYMVPAAFVRLDAFPLTPNGKLDRRALPAPDRDAFARQAYEAPQGEIETALATIWAELLGVERVSRHDSFFALGGHSLLAVQMIERLRRLGLGLAVRALFDTPTLSVLAQTLGQHREVVVPPNLITPDTATLTPELLPLIDLNQAEIDQIVEQVPGGLSNIQDIYALSPLQDGILFHHLLSTDGDPYLQVTQMAFADRERLDCYLTAVQQVVNRHDILRTAFVWEGLSTPAQVVWRRASPSVTELTLDLTDGPIIEQLARRFDPRQHRIDLTQAPLLRSAIAQDSDGRWLLLELQHHLIGDHATLEVMRAEVKAFIDGRGGALPPALPFRNLIAQTRLGMSPAEHERFFTDMLAGVDEPTLPFGLAEVHRDGAQVTESHRRLPQSLNDQLRAQARRLGVSLASLCHLAWAQVLARASGQQRVVFGTVLLGRMQAGEGADCAMGLFMNTLPLCLEVGSRGVEESVRYTHARLAGLLEHEHAPLALAQHCSGLEAGTPLFSALLNYRHNVMLLDEHQTMRGIEFLSFEERTNYPFTLSVEDGGSVLGLTAQVVQPLDAGRVCGYMQKALESLAEALEHAPGMPIRQLEIMPCDERTLLLETWNATAALYPAHECIHQLFEAQVERTPQAIALMYEEQALSYAELNAQANRLAHRLIKLGVEPDARVAICVERSPVMVVGLLAIMKAGGAYVPLDVAYPSERLEHILTDAAPAILLADAVGCAMLGEAALASLTVLDPNALPEEATTNPHVPELTSHHLAYVIYTSGSTGTPKGVMVEHHSLLNLYSELDRTIFTHCPAHAIMSLNASFAFDASWQSLFSLLNGYTLAIIPQNTRVDGTALLQFLETAGIDIFDCTPSQLEMLLSADLLKRKSPLTLLVGGEPISAQTWQVLVGAPQLKIYNVYGPTECTVDATIALLSSTQTIPTIGRPIANTRIYLLDTRGQPVPMGAVGELYIGGAGVARGYLNRPDLTAERFLTDSFSGNQHARIYKTGDLARYLPDGNLEFIGRNDHQVKIRGFRIELGEIEACLLVHPQVREVAVLALGEASAKRLIAYVVAEPDELLASTLRVHVAAGLPEYMVPTAFVRLDGFPLTPNGKLDRRALPAPDGDAFAREVYEAPQGELEIALAAIWAELFGIERVSRHDSFFVLGGHSLLAVQMIERLRRLGLGLSVRALFDTPTLSVLAQALGQHAEVVVPPNLITSDTAVLTPELLPLIDLNQAEIDQIVEQVPGGLSNIQDIYALSPLQDGILFHHLLATDGDPYLLTVQMAFADRERLDCYLDAVQQVVNRHDILRTAFIWEGLSTPAQVVWRQASLSITELTLDPADGPVIEQLARRFDPRQHRIDLTQAPLLRFVTAQDSNGRWLLLELQHHLIGDHSTLEVMRTEVRAFIDGRGDVLLPAQPFRNLIAQVRLGMSPAEHERFFTDMLADVDEPTLPFGLAEVHRDGAQVTESHRRLPQALNDRLRVQARRLSVSLASLCHLAWAQVLARASGQQRVVFGTVLLGRMRAGEGADRAMGLFINALPLRLELDSSGVEDSVRCTQARLAELLEYEHASLVLAQRCSGVAAGMPLFSALLNYRHNMMQLGKSQTVPGIELLGMQERTNYPFTLSVEDGSTALGLTAQVVQPFDAERVCGYMQQALESLVEALEHTPSMPVRQLEVMPRDERTLLLEAWNATAAPYPAHKCIHQLFEAQVERTPQATALVYEDQALSYTELNTRANVLAHQLIELGVQPDARVAICVARSPAMVIGLLAILKAGGAYVPLDSEYPSGRLAHILADTAPAILLADAAGRVALGEAILTSLTVLDPNELPELATTNPHVPGLTSHHLAYIVYTSGSTGTPKGVMVEHAQIVHLFDAAKAEGVQNKHRAPINHSVWMQQAYGLTPADRVLQKAPFSFDVSVWEFFCTLLNGATLVVAAPGVHRDPSALMDLMIRQRITTAHFVPSMLSAFLYGEGVQRHCTSMQRLICTGEALTSTNARLCQTLFPHAQLHNLYGPTEATIGVTAWTCPTGYAEEVVPIGRPIANTRLYLLDTYGQPVLLGAVGELYVGGASVVRGYLNRPDLTAERFLPDPFSECEGARMYKTGDLARYRPDGNLEFLGRNDHQVKMRGLRIELGEIKACLVEHPQVREAAVLALGEGSDKQLVAYVVAELDEQLARTLRAHLAARLPEYMVPSAFVRLDVLPLTSNGKLDRRALPILDGAAFAHQAYEAPQGEIETALAAIWAELLGVERVSRHDSFFALGGHSLLAVRLINRIAVLGAELPLATLFTSPYLAALAAALNERLSQRGSTLPAIMPVSREGILPLSFAQQRLWFLAQFEGMSETYHIPLALRLRGTLDVAALQQALNTLFARHESLRSVFVDDDGEPQVQLLAADSGLPMRWHDLRGATDADAQLERLSTEEACALFDLAQGPLIRACLIQLADDEHVFLLTQHHIVSDGWSFGVLLSELNALYAAYCAGEPDLLPPLAIQYPDYAAWQHQWLSSERLQVQSAYWRKTLADAPILLDLPTDRPRPPQQSFAGDQVPVCFDAQITQALKRLSQEHGTTLFMTLLAAWGAVLSRLSGQYDLIIGTPSANRNRREVETLIGFFVNMLALRLDLSGEPNTTELLKRVRQSVLAAQTHQDLPFEQVAKIVQPPRRLDHTPLFQVMFAWQNLEIGEWCLPGLETTPVALNYDTVKFDLELILYEAGDESVGNLRYATALFDRQTIEQHVGYLYEMLWTMVADEQSALDCSHMLLDLDPQEQT